MFVFVGFFFSCFLFVYLYCIVVSICVQKNKTINTLLGWAGLEVSKVVRAWLNRVGPQVAGSAPSAGSSGPASVQVWPQTGCNYCH